MKLSEIKLLFYYLFKNVDSKGLIIDIKKALVGFFILGIIVLIVANPTEQEHKNAIKYKLMQVKYLNDSEKLLFSSLGSDKLDSIFSELIGKEVYYQNYFIFSSTKNRRTNWELSEGFGGNIKINDNGISHNDLLTIAKEICIKVRASKEFIIGDAKDFGYLKIAEHDFPVEMTLLEGISACADLGYGWRLPTIDELQFMYTNKDQIGGFMQTVYWSSSSGFDQSTGLNSSWYLSFYNGDGSLYYKTTSKSRIRAVKSI